MSDNQIFSYTKRDYESARREGLSKIPSLSNGVWTDLNASDPGIIILDYVHALVDMIQYYQDHQALESFINTAKERTNIFRLAQQLSYKVRSAKGARVSVTFHTNFKYDETIKIPQYTRLSTSTGIQFITLKDAYLESGESDVEVDCIQGNLLTKIYDSSDISVYGEELGKQTVVLTADTIDTDFISITDNLGRVWKEVDTVIFSGSLDRVYQVDLNPDNSILITFGDGERGVAPTLTDVLMITYLLTDAENGRVGANAINTLLDEIVDSQGKYIDLIVTNKESSVGGSSAQSSTSIRELAPGAIKAQGRAVTLNDFENLAKMVDGVIGAKAYDVNIDPNIPYHEVRLLIIPEDYDAPSKLLSNRVYDYLYQKMIPPTNLQVFTPSVIYIDINVTVRALDKASSGSLEYNIRETIKTYFDNLSKEVGEDFYPSDLSAKISNIDNVRYVVSLTPSDIIEISNMSVARLGNLEINIQ